MSPHSAGILFFVPLFATIQHPARPICRAAVPIWNTGAFLGSPKSPNRQQAQHSPAAGDSFRVSDMPDSGQQASFLVRIFSDYPQSGKSVFLFGFSLRFCIRAVFFFCATFPDNGTAPGSGFTTTGKISAGPAAGDPVACCPGSGLPRLRPSYMRGNVGFCWGVTCCQSGISTDSRF